MEQVVLAISRRVGDEQVLETERKRALLRRCGVSEEELSRHGQLYLHVLSEAADLLAIKDTHNSSFVLALGELEDALEAAKRRSTSLRREHDASQRRAQELLGEWEQLQRVREQLATAAMEREEHESTSTMAQRAEELNDKQRAYETELSELQATLRDVDFETVVKDTLEHHAVSALEKECEEIEAQNRELRMQVHQFHGLPLSKELAAAQLAEARAALQRLEDQFSAQIQQMLDEALQQLFLSSRVTADDAATILMPPTDALLSPESPPPASFKDREAGLLRELAALYSKLNQVREKRVRAEEESARGPNGADGSGGRRRRVLLVTRTLPFTLVWEDAQSHWRAEFPENMSLDGAMETYLCLHENYDCVWIGSVHGDIEPSEQKALKEQLLEERKYCPVFLDPKRERLFYHGFCKTVMWPLFHSWPPTTDDQLSTHEVDAAAGYGDDGFDMDKMWQAYVATNQAFADAVQEVYEEGDLVWVQGYHLTLVPQMVQNLFPNDNIDVGYFLHVPFPSSELFRIMTHREEVLTGMLGANLLGFQTYEYARHFQSAAVRLLGLESSHKGVEYNGHFARVTICPVGIDAAKYTALMRTPAVLEQVALMTQQFGRKKVLLGVDALDLTRGLVHKLLAVEELFTQHPALSQDVVFLQIVTGAPPPTPDALLLGAQVESLVSRINSRLTAIGADGPVQYLNLTKELSQEALVALYALAHALVTTPIRDGMNTIPFEYVVCREARGQPARVVLSEFAGSAHSLSGAVLVNPWNTDEVLDALRAALLESDDANALRAHQSMFSYVRTFTSRHWADNFLEQLRECGEEHALAVSGRELSRRDMTSAYARSSRRLLFVTYEGVLAAEASIPELSYPPPELLWRLAMLARDPRNTVVIVCARSTAVCEQWFASLAGSVVLAAEYGVYVKWLGAHEYWHCMVPNMDMGWWEHVLPLLEYYTERTPGAFIERKDSSIAWHYRDCDLDHGLWQASELLVSLRELTRSLPVAVCPGNRVLEVRPQKASKAWLFERVWEFMNYAVLFPDEKDDAPVTTDYFGDPVKPLSSPLTKPWSAPSSSSSNGTGTGGNNGNEEPAADAWRSELPHLRPLGLNSEATVGTSTSTGHESVDGSSSSSTVAAHDAGSETAGASDAEKDAADPQQPVDFLLVIASGEDRTDEDLFAYLVPAPIDLAAYCQQLDKDQSVRASTHPQDVDANNSPDHHRGLAATGSFRLPSSASTKSGSDAVSTGGGTGTADDDATPPPRLSPRGSFRRLLHLDSASSLSEATGTLHASGADVDILLLGENITKLTPLYAHGSKARISDDAAHMFPRTLLATPSTARRDEITERSKFTPRRDFPPSAALFKAMKSKYGENFSMHRLPDTPAAAWALVVPPTARAKLEDAQAAPSITSASASATTSHSASSPPESDHPKLSVGSSTGAAAAAAAVAGSPTSSTLDGGAAGTSDSYGSYSPPTSVADGDEQMRREIEALRSLEEDVGGGDGDDDAGDDAYRFPVNTFVCTLGRKLSQAPYFIKNSADLFQLLQEMGLSSHIRKQRMLSVSSHLDE
ncbi:hypothetical protein PybrP1_002392 [[Pythium] brassicae (nom. inval.)]|nr:hypothetical protein PybrP1_002392 [[Pythium] brassicae (nom. inval.)]